LLPRDPYKTISIKDKTVSKFQKAAEKAKVLDDEMSQTGFLWYLLEMYDSNKSP